MDAAAEYSADQSRKAAVAVIRRLREHGHDAYLAGGCVRDRLLGLKPQDYDVATSATPDVVQALFTRTRAVGEAFGVILVYQGSTGHRSPQTPWIATEVATFRSDGDYHDGRRPSAVAFTDARQDAYRRDFTINALFEDPLHSEIPNADADPQGIIDYVGGMTDLKASRLRAVGEAQQRFSEDYLRMLRAVRFAARFNLEIESRTAAAIRESAKNLGRISRERIGQEVRVMLVHPARADAIRLLQDHRLDGPVLQDDCQVGDDVVVPALPNECDYPTVLAGWAIDRAIGSAAKPDSLEALLKVLPQPRQIAQWRKALVLSNDERDAVKAIAQRLTDATQWSRLSTAGRKRVLTAPDWEQAAVLLQAIGLYDCMACEIEKLTNDGIGLTPEAFLDGQKLIALGVKPGPRLGELLTEVYDLQLEGELITMSDAERWIEQHR